MSDVDHKLVLVVTGRLSERSAFAITFTTFVLIHIIHLPDPHFKAFKITSAS